MKGRTAIAKILKMEGVEFVSGFPQNDIFEAGAEEGIRCIIARTERVGVNIADAYTRVSNGKRIGVCLVQSGPGIENAASSALRVLLPPKTTRALPSGRIRLISPTVSRR